MAGNGTIATSGNTMTITQGSPAGIINWNAFSIGSGGLVDVQNGSGATLSRVLGSDPSTILGQLRATGSFFLVNPNGVVIGPGGQVVVGQTFVASTRALTDADFLAGRLRFEGTGGGEIANDGRIHAAGGDVVLIGRRVANGGAIEAPAGDALLAGGDRVELRSADHVGERIRILPDGNGAVDNQGGIAAVAAELRAAGGNMYALAGNNGGTIRATGVDRRDGKVVLTAGGKVANSGTLAARNADGAGGSVRLESVGDTATMAGTIDVAAVTGRGGEAQVTGAGVHLSGAARIDASGPAGGGTILVGGGFGGFAPDLPNARVTLVDPAVLLRADALAAGMGGRIAIWSEDYTGFAAALSARGGVTGGDGGFIEVSSRGLLDYRGQADTLAPLGRTGTLLLDPTFINIQDAQFGGFDNPDGTFNSFNIGAYTFNANGQILSGQGNANASLSPGGVVAALAGSHVVLQSSGDISLNFMAGGIVSASGNSLSLQAGGNLTLGNDINQVRVSGGLFFYAGVTGFTSAFAGGVIATPTLGGAGNVEIRDDIRGDAGVVLGAGGNVTLTNTATVTTAGASDIVLAANGNFVNQAGAGVLTLGTGRSIIYTATAAGATLGGLNQATTLNSTTFAANPPGTLGGGTILALAEAAAAPGATNRPATAPAQITAEVVVNPRPTSEALAASQKADAEIKLASTGPVTAFAETGPQSGPPPGPQTVAALTTLVSPNVQPPPGAPVSTGGDGATFILGLKDNEDARDLALGMALDELGAAGAAVNVAFAAIDTANMINEPSKENALALAETLISFTPTGGVAMTVKSILRVAAPEVAEATDRVALSLMGGDFKGALQAVGDTFTSALSAIGNFLGGGSVDQYFSKTKTYKPLDDLLVADKPIEQIRADIEALFDHRIRNHRNGVKPALYDSTKARITNDKAYVMARVDEWIVRARRGAGLPPIAPSWYREADTIISGIMTADEPMTDIYAKLVAAVQNAKSPLKERMSERIVAFPQDFFDAITAARVAAGKPQYSPAYEAWRGVVAEQAKAKVDAILAEKVHVSDKVAMLRELRENARPFEELVDAQLARPRLLRQVAEWIPDLVSHQLAASPAPTNLDEIKARLKEAEQFTFPFNAAFNQIVEMQILAAASALPAGLKLAKPTDNARDNGLMILTDISRLKNLKGRLFLGIADSSGQASKPGLNVQLPLKIGQSAYAR